MRCPKPTGKFLVSCVAVVLMVVGPLAQRAQAQNPPQRQIRTYIPPDQLVSFLPSTPFDRFVEFVDPIFLRVTGKQIVDPEARTQPIGVSIASMHFFDAFELVLQYNGLTFSETEQFFIIAPATTVDPNTGAVVAADGVGPQLPATHDTREIQINALLFELDHSVARDTGIDWNIFFGEETGGQGQGGSGGASGGAGGALGQNQPKFFLKTNDIFSSLEDIIVAPSRIDFTDLTQFFRLLETEGVGETIASPHVTVQSGIEGRMQIGSDVPVQVRDFAGNTITQFFSTGIIVNVLPTFVRQQAEDSTGRLSEIEFIHLEVQVEKSGSTPSPTGPVIDRSTANTQVLLLDGEQTVIGGLYTTEETVSRRGIPVLKDLPGWFFGLRYVFGRTQRAVSQKELMIVLQARVLDGLKERARRPLNRDLLEQKRQEIDQTVRRFDGQVGAARPTPQVYVKGNQ